MLLLFMLPGIGAESKPPLLTFVRGNKIWIRESGGQERAVFTGKDESWSQPALSQDRKKIAVVIKDDLWVVNLETGKSRLAAKGGRKRFAGTPAWLPNGTSVIVGRWLDKDIDGDGGLWLLDLITGKSKIIIKPEDADGQIHAFPVLSPDGRFVASLGGMDMFGTLRVVDLTTMKIVPQPNSPVLENGYCWCMDWDKADDTLVIGCFADEEEDGPNGKGIGGIWRWNIKTGKLTPWICRDEDIYDLSISPDGSKLIVNGTRILSRDGKTIGQIKVPIKVPEERCITIMAWVTNDSIIFTVPKDDGEISHVIQYNLATGESLVLVTN